MGGGENSRGKRAMETPENYAVKLCIKSQDGKDDYYRINSNATIQKLLKDYCKVKHLKYKHVTFLHEGARLAVDGTIHELGIVDGDQIDAMVTQSGGGPSKCAM